VSAGLVIDTVGGESTLSTVTVLESAPVWPIVSVAVAVIVCSPSEVGTVFQDTDHPLVPFVPVPITRRRP
jgi:hypothetical protein